MKEKLTVAAVPWTLQFYCDEVSAGDPPRFNPRKVQAIYWTFRELGPEVLSLRDSRFTLTAVRSEYIQEFPGGMSNLFRLLLLKYFFWPEFQLPRIRYSIAVWW